VWSTSAPSTSALSARGRSNDGNPHRAPNGFHGNWVAARK
jgi:hypothetical protein